jgi:hypothetical protein
MRRPLSLNIAASALRRGGAVLVVAISATFVCAQRCAAQEAPSGEAVFRAAAAGDAQLVSKLVLAGAPANWRDPAGRTPLLVATEHNHEAVVRHLLAAGADINAQALNKDTPWLLAGAMGRASLLDRMIPLGPDFSIRNRFGGNALIPACHYGHVEAVKVLLKTRIALDHINDLGWTCLLEAVLLGDGGPAHQEIVRLVLAAGADPNIPDKNGVTALAHADKRGQRAVAQLLREAGAR